MFQKIAKHRANDASHDVHRTPLVECEEDEEMWGRKVGNMRIFN